MTELGTDARRLIDLVRASDEPALADQRRVAQGVAASVGMLASSLAEAGTGVVTLTAVPVARTATAGLLVKALSASVIGLGLGFVVAVPAALVASKPAPAAPAPVVAAPVPAPRVEAAPRVVGPPVEREPAQSVRARPRAGTTADDGALAREIELLAAVQGELQKGRGQRALELLNAYERGAGASALGPERAAARVLALCAVGDARSARRVAETFLIGSPDSPVVPRIRRSCAFAEPGSSAAPITDSPSSRHSAGP